MTPEEVNALPPKVKDYIHALSTRCDPAGDIQELVCRREQVKALEILGAELKKDVSTYVAELKLAQGALKILSQQNHRTAMAYFSGLAMQQGRPKVI